MPKPDAKTDCPCTWPCDRHADCEACRAYHHGHGEKTCCERSGKKKDQAKKT